MELQIALKSIFEQLTTVITQIDDVEFVSPVPSLNGSTMGQHIRHTLEFFICLSEGYESGLVNYDKRAHDKEIEETREIALSKIRSLEGFTSNLPTDKDFVLEANYNANSDSTQQVRTTFYRELVYNVEHAIHHMALIKVGLRELCPHVKIPAGFGIAVSTVKYQASKA